MNAQWKPSVARIQAMYVKGEISMAQYLRLLRRLRQRTTLA